MEKTLTFNIDDIMAETPIEYSGHILSEYASVYVAEFSHGLRKYTINAIFDLYTDEKLLVVADEATDVILTRLLGE